MPDGWHTSFVMSVDGVHCRFHEKKHRKKSKNPKYYSHKFNGPALGYELALDIFENKLVWLNGPFPAGKGDYAVFKKHLRKKIPAGKKAVTDHGYRKKGDTKIAPPNSHDPEELRTFKARCRMRQEHFNSRVKCFDCMKNDFRHSMDRHGDCFVAVCVICVYEMELVSPLFDV